MASGVSFLGSGSALLETLVGTSHDDDDYYYEEEPSESWVPKPEATILDSCGARVPLNASGALAASSDSEHYLPGDAITLEEAGYEITPSGCLILNEKYQMAAKPVWIKDPVAAAAFRGVSLGSNECLICWCDIEPDEKRVLKCGHQYCASCLSTTFDAAASQNQSMWTHNRSQLDLTPRGDYRLYSRQIIGLMCPHPICSHIVTVEELLAYSASGQLKILDALLHIRLFEWAANDEVAKCPLNCGGWIQNCECTMEACRKKTRGDVALKKRMIAAERAHGSMIRKWASTVNARMCPRCDKIIEKNGGCNHMNCTQCKLQFNWTQARLIFKQV